MVYPSHIIDSFAFVLEYIEEKKKAYEEYSIQLDYEIIVRGKDKYVVLIKLYEL